VRQRFNSASYTDPYTVFNIKGNDYPLVTYIDYERAARLADFFHVSPAAFFPARR
jgi:mRNA-degrading endonuclease HigB of HigAB toxin-antitoxin module